MTEPLASPLASSLALSLASALVDSGRTDSLIQTESGVAITTETSPGYPLNPE